mgnify:CR=1 FL=1
MRSRRSSTGRLSTWHVRLPLSLCTAAHPSASSEPPHPPALVAAALGVCTTVLKKVCRRHGIRRWPQRKLQSLNKLISNLHHAMQSTDSAPPLPPPPRPAAAPLRLPPPDPSLHAQLSLTPTPTVPLRECAGAEEHQRLAQEIINLQTRKAILTAPIVRTGVVEPSQEEVLAQQDRSGARAPRPVPPHPSPPSPPSPSVPARARALAPRPPPPHALLLTRRTGFPSPRRQASTRSTTRT